MQTVTREQIVETWEELCDLDQKQTDVLVKQFMEQQPALGVYMSANLENLGEEAQDSPVIDLVMTTWQTMSKAAGRTIPALSPEDIDKAEEANLQALEKLNEGSDADLQNSQRELVESYNQRELLGFCVEVLMGRYEEEPEMAPESIGMEMLWLKTVIDCLDR